MERTVRPLSMADRLHIDQVCRGFEAAWQGAEAPPSLDTCLEDVSELERSELLRELLLLDLDYRRRKGEAPGPEEYYRRFPQDKQIIDRAFGAAGSSFGASPLGGIGRSFGDYELLEEIGRGGMGVVYKAEQVSLGRHVALKLLPFAAALDDRQLRRFKNEAQAAAQLHHTHIVPVFSIGCERGVHYYAMQYIEGHPLTAVIRELRHLADLESIDVGSGTPSVSAVTSSLASGRWAPAEIQATGSSVVTISKPGDSTGSDVRSGLGELSSRASTRDRPFFRSVADLGVQAAEALQHAHEAGIVHRDIKPSNLLLDVRGHLWITDFGLALVQTEATVTMAGDLVGTIRYMSPEQALARRVPLDHRTDIYSLGVTLYELLGLRPAFAGQSRQELLRQIVFEDPRPLRKVNPHIPRELETIVGKAIAKNPAERFSTAEEMADDLRRFLEDKPIQAKPPTVLDRATKWSRRHRSVVVSAAVLVVMAVAALSVGTVLLWRERARTQQALARARINFERARDAVDRYFTLTSQSTLLERPELLDLRKELLESALRYYKEFAEQRADDPEIRGELTAAYFRIAEISNALGSSDWVLALAKGVDIADQLVTEGVDVSRFPSWRAGIVKVRSKGTFQALKALASDAVGRSAHKAAAIWEKLVRQHPDVPGFRSDLAIFYLVLSLTQRTPQEELRYATLSWDLWDGLARDYPAEPEYRFMLASAQFTRACVLDAVGRAKEAEVVLCRSVDLLDKLVSDFPSAPAYATELLAHRHLLAQIYAATGRSREAGEMLRRQSDLLKKLAAEFPAKQEYAEHLARTLRNLPKNPGQSAEAEEMLRWGLDFFKKLVAESPAKQEYAGSLAETYRSLGDVLKNSGRSQEAEETYREGIRILNKLVAGSPSNSKYKLDLGHLHWTLGDLLSSTGRTHDAEIVHRRAIELFDKLVSDFPKKFHRQEQAFSRWKLGGLMESTGRDGEAVEAYREAVKLHEKLAADFPAEAEFRSRLFRSLIFLGRVLWKAGQTEAAKEAYREGLRILEKPAADVPHDPGYRRAVGTELNNLAWRIVTSEDTHYRDSDWAVELAKKAIEYAPDSRYIWNTLGVAHYRAGDWTAAIEALEKSMELGGCGASDGFFLAMACRKLGNDEEAHLWYDTATAWMDKHAPNDKKLARFRGEAADVLGLPPPSTQTSQPSKADEVALYTAILKRHPDAAWAYANRGTAYAELRQWDKAAADFAKGGELAPNDPHRRYWQYWHALVCLLLGDTDGYRSACASMVERFDRTEDAQLADRRAWACALGPDAVSDLAVPLLLAEKAYRSDPKNEGYVKSLGAILYRAGRFEEAVGRLNEANALYDQAYIKPTHSSPAYTWFFLAMVEAQLGHREEASKWFEKAVQHADREIQGNPLWNRRLTLQLLRHEAAGLLGIDQEGGGRQVPTRSEHH